MKTVVGVSGIPILRAPCQPGVNSVGLGFRV